MSTDTRSHDAWLMRPGMPDDWGILPLQNVILNIAKYIDDVCAENDIDYCLVGGSALGSVRHSGFIPWDDDLDMYMTPDNYDRFRSFFLSHGDSQAFHLQEFSPTDGMIRFAKLRMNNTDYIEPRLQHLHIHHGVGVDIFILHNCPPGALRQRWQYLWAKYALSSSLAFQRYRPPGRAMQLFMSARRQLPPRLFLGYALRQVYRYRNRDTALLCDYMGRERLHTGRYLRDIMLPTVRAPFETLSLRVPADTHAFLSQVFGDYMVPPPPDTVRKSQHAHHWSVDRLGQVGDASPPDLSEESALL